MMLLNFNHSWITSMTSEKYAKRTREREREREKTTIFETSGKSLDPSVACFSIVKDIECKNNQSHVSKLILSYFSISETNWNYRN